MKMFLDTAKTDEIQHALEMWDIDGVTTNPKHVANSGKPFRAVLEEIAEIFGGTDKPVSVEVNPHLTDWKQIVEEGQQLAAISPNFVVKVGASEDGFRAVRELTARGIRVNTTLVFSVTQAWHAARSGAVYVSPFLGWKESHGEEVRSFIGEVSRMLQAGGYSTQILAAAIRNSRQMAEAAMAGAHCITAGFQVYRDSFDNPYSDMGVKIFSDAWDATPRQQ